MKQTNNKRIRKRQSGILLCFLYFTLVGIMLSMTGCKGKTEKALSSKERNLIIINDTDAVINKVQVYAGEEEDIEIENAVKEKVDEHSFPIKIPKEYKKESSFTVTFYDVYDLKYSKTIKKVAKKGPTKVKITKKDYVARKGDWKRKLDRLMNE